MKPKKFTMLGEVRSGKTCYLLGMYMAMSMDLESIGYTIIARDADVRKQLTTRYQKLEDESYGESRFPQGTNDVNKYNFDLQYAFETILPFEWIDYPGAFLDPTQNDPTSAKYKEVEKSISESSTIFICIDGANLVDGDTNAKIRRVKRKSVSRISPYLGELKEKLKREGKRLPPICIIVTKFDLCVDIYEKELREIIEESFKPLFMSNDTLVAVVPVSLGDNITDDNYKGEFDPINIHLPILFGINFALNEVISDCVDSMERKDAYINSLKAAKYDEEDSFFLWRDNKKIDRLANSIYSTANEIEELYKTAKIAEKNQNSVLDELGAINMLFHEGRWTL